MGASGSTAVGTDARPRSRRGLASREAERPAGARGRRQRRLRSGLRNGRGGRGEAPRQRLGPSTGDTVGLMGSARCCLASARSASQGPSDGGIAVEEGRNSLPDDDAGPGGVAVVFTWRGGRGSVDRQALGLVLVRGSRGKCTGGDRERNLELGADERQHGQARAPGSHSPEWLAADGTLGRRD